MVLEMRPHILHRIEIWRIRRQALCPHFALGRCKIVGHQPAAVNGRTIPDDQDALFDMTLQMPDKRHHLRPFDAAFMDLEVEAPQAQATDDREAFPTEALQQQGRLPAQCPSPCARRFGAQSAFVDEDDDALLTPRVFFSAGQVLRCQTRTAFSSRSMARLSGR